MADSTPASSPPYSPSAAPSKNRIDSIDLLRGIVMVIMMLDHTRDFVHRDVLMGIDPTDLSHTTVWVFFTRWITHFCAPVFVLLAGTAIYLQLLRGKTKGAMSRFLISRGLWLIVLEFTVVRIAMTFNLDYRFLGVAQVIWVIGVSMICMAALIHLPAKAVVMFGVAMIMLHNLLDKIRVDGWHGPESAVPPAAAKLWMLLHQPFEGFPVLGFPSPVVFIIYPIIPWVGVMAAGYGLGALYKVDAKVRRQLLLVIGSLATAVFVVQRLINHYGDPNPWARQDTIAFTILSFFNTTKYPPSLLFLLMTLGPALIGLALLEKQEGAKTNGRIREVFITFGRVPLFFYILQWYAAHLISLLLHYLAGKPVGWMFSSAVEFTRPPAGAGFSLLIVYLSWIAGVILLYPLCKWFAGLKARRRSWWLSYL